jgi:hypothetical protein
MSRCRRIVEAANNLVDFLGGDSVVLGGWVVVSFYEVGWEGRSVLRL